MSTVLSNQTEERVVHVAGPRPTRTQFAHELADVAVAVPLFAAGPLLRRWHRRWGATDAEVAAAMPGDELVPGSQTFCTRAITIDAPPGAVWPWLVQVGFGKAGFYANDLLDNVAHPSADRILDEFQDPKVGDWVPMFSKVNDTTAFRIAAIKPAEELVWGKPDSTWAWTLTDIGGRTRLVTRVRILHQWQRRTDAVMSFVLMEFGDFPMMRKMLLTLKLRAEAALPANGPDGARCASRPSPCRRIARTTAIRFAWTGAGLGALAAARDRYRRDLQQDYERLHAFERSNLETPLGRVEYAQASEGPPGTRRLRWLRLRRRDRAREPPARLPNHRAVAVRLSRLAVPARSLTRRSS
jgi:hypothetical protein